MHGGKIKHDARVNKAKGNNAHHQIVPESKFGFHKSSLLLMLFTSRQASKQKD
jgi:hypothetical protein|tara:strand:- start:17071 stop:17229 length:159 start_codon:yes stop_codon:yes gene_type:complete